MTATCGQRGLNRKQHCPCIAVAIDTQLNGYRATTLNFDSLSKLTFACTVAPQLLVTGLWYSLILGTLADCCPAYAPRGCL